MGKHKRTAPRERCRPFVFLYASGQVGPRSGLPVFKIIRRFFHSAEVKDLIELGQYLLDFLCMEAAVFHRFDDIATASVVAPFFTHSFICPFHRKLGVLALYVWPVTRQRYFSASTPAGLCGKLERISRQLIPCGPLQIVAVGWLVPTCGMGSDRSFPSRKSLCVPAAWLPAGYSKLPAIQL